MKPITEILKKWLSPLGENRPLLYLVGGAVRDGFLNRPVKDIDIICRDAEEVASTIAASGDIAVVRFEKRVGEICCRLVNRKQKDMFLDIVKMRGASILEDIRLRDFTINAMATQISQGGALGEVLDPESGKEDLEHRLIRMVGPDAFPDDPLRILRAVRLAAALDFSIEEKTLDAMKTHAPKLSNVTGERIREELMGIFGTRQSTAFVQLMDQSGVLEVLFPVISKMKNCEQNRFHHLDVWNHSLMVLKECEDIINHLQASFGSAGKRVQEILRHNRRLELLKLAAVLHDMGKPETMAWDETDRRITFYGHAQKGVEMISHVADRLRMPNQDREFLQTLIAEHLHVQDLSYSGVNPRTLMKWFRRLKDDAIPLIILGMADIRATLGPAAEKEIRQRHIQWSKDMVFAYYERIKKQLDRKDFIKGRDLMAMGALPGPNMGSILKKVRKLQDTGEIHSRKEALSAAKKLLSDI